MDLFNEVRDYIINSNEFDESLALKIIQYQAEKIPFYREFLQKIAGKLHFKNLSEVPPFPVEFFKRTRLFAEKNPTGYFESSGTTGNKSKVYYHKKSLNLYRISSIKAYPLGRRPVKTLIDLSLYRSSSLAFMVKHFIETYGGKQIENIKEEVEDGDVLFLTALQLFKYISSADKTFDKHFYIIETGGYKKFSSEYNRHKLYHEAKKIFRNASFYTEYGMTELFSQFYASENKSFQEQHFLKVIDHKYGYLKVFDFANLYHISYLIVPDIIDWQGNGFEYIKRDVSDERGCSYTFG